MRFFRNRGFAATNGVSLRCSSARSARSSCSPSSSRSAQGYSPLEAGIRTLPWTAMPIFVAPRGRASCPTGSAAGR